MQVLTSEGLLRYVDSRCVRRELSEALIAGGLSDQQLDDAAHDLLYMRQEPAAAAAAAPRDHAPATARRPPYYEHLGGYAMHELHDFNQYSTGSNQRPVATTSASGSGVLSWWQRRRQRAASRDKSPSRPPPTDETTMYITSV